MELNEAASLIADIVRRAGTITGANLARQLRVVDPLWSPQDYGVGSLRAFLAQHVSSVAIAGRSGMDLVYRSSPLDGPTSGVKEPNLWQTWVSPNSPYALFVDGTRGAVVAKPRSEEPLRDEHRLMPLSLTSHQGFALQFLGECVPAEAQDDLRSIATSDSPSWWQTWSARIKRIGLAQQWKAFRQEKLLAELDAHLRALGIPAPLVEQIKLKIVSWHESSRPRKELQPKRPEKPQVPDVDSLKHIRTLAIRVIERMTEQEIRELRLPLGHLLDISRGMDL